MQISSRISPRNLQGLVHIEKVTPDPPWQGVEVGRPISKTNGMMTYEGDSESQTNGVWLVVTMHRLSMLRIVQTACAISSFFVFLTVTTVSL